MSEFISFRLTIKPRIARVINPPIAIDWSIAGPFLVDRQPVSTSRTVHPVRTLFLLLNVLRKLLIYTFTLLAIHLYYWYYNLPFAICLMIYKASSRITKGRAPLLYENEISYVVVKAFIFLINFIKS